MLSSVALIVTYCNVCVSPQNVYLLHRPSLRAGIFDTPWATVMYFTFLEISNLYIIGASWSRPQMQFECLKIDVKNRYFYNSLFTSCVLTFANIFTSSSNQLYMISSFGTKSNAKPELKIKFIQQEAGENLWLLFSYVKTLV